MTLRDFLIAIGIITGLAWAAWFVVLFMINPLAAGFVGIAVFYAALFLALLGTGVLLGLLIRVVAKRVAHEQVLVFKLVLPSLRQSIWFAALITISLWLLAQELFTWWSVILLLSGLAILEAFYVFQQADNGRPSPASKADTDTDIQQI